MKKKLNLTIDTELYAELGSLPRSTNVSEVVTFLLKCYLETIKRGREPNDEEFNGIVESMGGKAFRERMRTSLGPVVDKIDWVGRRFKTALGLNVEGEEKN